MAHGTAPMNFAQVMALGRQHDSSSSNSSESDREGPPAAATAAVVLRDQLGEYLAMPDIGKDGDLLGFWTMKQHVWPELACMALQYLSVPATSAAVERIFSSAGKLFSDLRKSIKDGNLESRLFAKANTA